MNFQDNSIRPAVTGAFSAEGDAFAAEFERLTGNPPYRWQQRLYDQFVAHNLPTAIDLPTGLGKTSVMAIWLIARQANPALPRRLVYVVDRRVVVDQATTEAERMKEKSEAPPLTISTLRGQHADKRVWLEDPSRAAIIVGTIDMIGSRLLFEGYGVGRRMRPYHAGLLGADTLVVLDEAHLCPPFEALVRAIADDPSLKPEGAARRAIVPPLHLLPLSATGGDGGKKPFRLEAEDWDAATQPRVHQRFTARKRLRLHEVSDSKALAEALADRAWALGEGGRRVLIYCHAHETAKRVAEALQGSAKEKRVVDRELIVGKRRVYERQALLCRLKELGFIGGGGDRGAPAFVVATSAGEVGIDIDADHMVSDLVAFERMVQRLGRVNRAGGDGRVATVEVVCTPSEPPKAGAKDDAKTRAAHERVALFDAAKAALEALPTDADGGRDASPRAIAMLKETQPDLVQAATTPEPLRPALDRAVVDAWSMTSLAEHTGRPEPEPWLRGWIDDDEPQTQVIWRRWLPWRRKAREQVEEELPVAAEVEDFFDAARPHASEILEAPVELVIETLITRARAQIRAHFEERKSAADLGEGESNDAALSGKAKTQEGIIVLTPGRELKRLREQPRSGARSEAACGAWTTQQLAKVPPKGKSAERDALISLLTNAIVVVSASLGGLAANGLLDADAAEGAAVIADAPDVDETAWPRGFRILRPDEPNPGHETWKEVLSLPLTTGDEDEPSAITVLVSRGADSERSGDPALGRRAQELGEHGAWAAEAAQQLADALRLSPDYKATLVAAAHAHDLGKARDLWQNAMRAPRDDGRPYAKTTSKGDPARLKIGEHTYRHEFGSLRDAEADIRALDVPEELRDLALHLIAAHHGFARPVIAPADPLAPPSASAARACEVALRFARLQRQWGPWGLAWWEALLRAADQQASRKLDKGGA